MRGVSSWAKEAYERDNWHCRSCNNTASLTPHHIKFRSHGGTDTLDNLLTLCWRCHRNLHDGFLVITIDQDTSEIHFERKKGFKI